MRLHNLGEKDTLQSSLRNTYQSWMSLKRITKRRFWAIVGSSILAMGVLIYQTVEYIIGLDCCEGDLPEIAQAFREYGVFLGIPISFFGILQMVLTIGLVGLISTIPTPEVNETEDSRLFQLLRPFYLFLLFELLLSSILVVNLIYIEFFVIGSICLTCTVSQMVILSNTVIIYLWNP